MSDDVFKLFREYVPIDPMYSCSGLLTCHLDLNFYTFFTYSFYLPAILVRPMVDHSESAVPPLRLCPISCLCKKIPGSVSEDPYAKMAPKIAS